MTEGERSERQDVAAQSMRIAMTWRDGVARVPLAPIGRSEGMPLWARKLRSQEERRCQLICTSSTILSVDLHHGVTRICGNSMYTDSGHDLLVLRSLAMNCQMSPTTTTMGSPARRYSSGTRRNCMIVAREWVCAAS